MEMQTSGLLSVNRQVNRMMTNHKNIKKKTEQKIPTARSRNKKKTLSVYSNLPKLNTIGPATQRIWCKNIDNKDNYV